MIGKIAKGALAVCVIVLLTLATLELSIRLIGYTDSNGQFLIFDRTLPPYVVPLDRIESELQEYFNNKEAVTLIPDPATGWTYRPNSKRQDGTFTVNGAGLRALREYTMKPAADTLRIALFGDSFVAGDEVTDEKAWALLLEQELNRAGLKAEVLNFGVSGYSMTQAFLRWQSLGKRFSPDMVIFVFQAENLDRNVNVFHQLYWQGGAVYSKPRFIIEDGSLSLVNSPVIPPEDLLDVMRAFDSHPLATHEAFYKGRDASSPIWRMSRVAGLLYDTFSHLNAVVAPARVYGADSERGQLGEAIVGAFAADVASSDATFTVLHLPHIIHFRAFHAGERAPWQFLLDHFQDVYHFINATDFLGVEYTDDSYFQPFAHYGPEINARIAEVVSMEIVTCIQEDTCQLPRFENTSDIWK